LTHWNVLFDSFKAVFYSSDVDKEISLEDAHFWEKVLPSQKLSSKISDMIRSDVHTPEDVADLIANLKVLVEDLKMENSNLGDAISVLKRAHAFAGKSPHFSADQKHLIDSWLVTLQIPQTRRRREHVSTDRQNVRMKKEEKKEEPSEETSKEKDEKTPSEKVPKRKKEEKVPPVTDATDRFPEISKAFRDRLRTALTTFGYGVRTQKTRNEPFFF
jgi:hypothetical protein